MEYFAKRVAADPDDLNWGTTKLMLNTLPVAVIACALFRSWAGNTGAHGMIAPNILARDLEIRCVSGHTW